MEGEEAYKYVKSLNKNLDELQKSIIIQLDGIRDYIKEYTAKDGDKYEIMYENVMEVGERCSTAAVLLNNLAEYIDERIE